MATGWFAQMSIGALATSVRIGTPPYTARIPCDIPCVRGTVPNGLIRTILLPDLNGTIVLSMEGSKYYPQLILKPKRERYIRRSFVGTTSLESDVPMPYYNWSWTQFLERPPTTGHIWTENHIQTTRPHLTQLSHQRCFWHGTAIRETIGKQWSARFNRTGCQLFHQAGV